ncbi:MAG: hypothetical protein R3E68_02620 [Burkholderiaceae bacterium]
MMLTNRYFFRFAARACRMELDRIRHAAHCAQWLQRTVLGLSGSQERLSAMTPLLLRLGRHDGSPNTVLKMLEEVRRVAVVEAERVFELAALTSLPLDAQMQASVQAADITLEHLAQLYSVLHRQMDVALAMHRVIERAGNSLRSVLPLARALDAQSRRVAGLLRAQVVVSTEHWLDLARLGSRMRDTTYLDVNLRDPLTRLRPCNARALFIHPFLLQLAASIDALPGQALQIDAVCRRWAHRVGFRIDFGVAPRANPYGPTLVLDAGCHVRLDTHRLTKSLAREPHRADADTASALSQAALAALERAWTTPGPRRGPQPADGREVRLCLGLPGPYLQAARRSGQDGAAYSWGEYEHTPRPSRQSDSAALAALFARAERASWTSTDGDRLLLDRRSPLPSPARDGLVALMADAGQAAGGGGPGRLQLALIRSVGQLLGGGPSSHRIGVQTMPGVSEPVGIVDGGEAGGADGFLMTAGSGDDREATMFAPGGRLQDGARLRLRRDRADLTIDVLARSGAGPGYERFRVRACGSGRF